MRSQIDLGIDATDRIFTPDQKLTFRRQRDLRTRVAHDQARARGRRRCFDGNFRFDRSGSLGLLEDGAAVAAECIPFFHFGATGRAGRWSRRCRRWCFLHNRLGYRYLNRRRLYGRCLDNRRFDDRHFCLRLGNCFRLRRSHVNGFRFYLRLGHGICRGICHGICRGFCRSLNLRNRLWWQGCLGQRRTAVGAERLIWQDRSATSGAGRTRRRLLDIRLRNALSSWGLFLCIGYHWLCFSSRNRCLQR
jgi:hypothetical protein